MFAVIKTGGKQYRVSAGDLLKIERLEGEAGQAINFSSVLLINDEGKISVGTPLLDKTQVRATIVEQTRGDKIIVFKKKRRQGYRRKAGHRQDLTMIRVEEILVQGESRSSSRKKAEATTTQEAEDIVTEKPTVQAEAGTLETPSTVLEVATAEKKKGNSGERRKTQKTASQETSGSEDKKSEQK